MTNDAEKTPPTSRGGLWRLPSDEQPDPPKDGIPPYRTSRWFRVWMRMLVYPWMMLDLVVQSLVKKLFPPPYRIEGHCKKRGNCCHYILMEWDSWMEKIPWLGRLWMWWYTQIHGFYARGFDVENVDGRVARVMGCRHLQSNGQCAEYLWRPAICRQWPRITYTNQPYLLKGCGYITVPRHHDPKTSANVTDHDQPSQQLTPAQEITDKVQPTDDQQRQEAMHRVKQKLGWKENVQEREE